MSDLHVVGISGSLRRDSYNAALIRTAAALAPEGVAVEPLEIRDIPLFDQDVEAQGDPEPVRAMKERIREADALLVATPEYSWSMPGVLKNALDWASRPVGASVLKQKPVAIMGASTGPFGTARAQLVLRQVLAYNDSLVLATPGVLIANAKDRFGEDGELTDERARESVRALVAALADWTRRLRPA